MLDDSKEAGIGHNSGADLPYDVTKFQPLELRAREIADAGADWIKLPKIETEEQAQKANDFLAQVKKIEKDTEAERKAQKAPHESRVFTASFLERLALLNHAERELRRLGLHVVWSRLAGPKPQAHIQRDETKSLAPLLNRMGPRSFRDEAGCKLVSGEFEGVIVSWVEPS